MNSVPEKVTCPRVDLTETMQVGSGRQRSAPQHRVVVMIDSITVTVYTLAMNTDDRGMTIEELADLVGVPVRTVRYYITEHLLPGPGTRGKGTIYTQEQLLRLKLIRLLAEQRLPLAEIRERLAGLSTRDVQALLGEEDRRAHEKEGSAGPQSPRDYISTLLGRARAAGPTPSPDPSRPAAPQAQASPDPASSGASSQAAPGSTPGESWHRLPLAPGVELHVRAEAWDRYRKLIDKILKAARASGSLRDL
jgi:DNA-binding transcriptional MerR regulator